MPEWPGGGRTDKGGEIMSQMKVKKLFHREDGKKVMEINVLPAKYCTFRCVFCPIREKGTQTEISYRFDETEAFLEELAKRIDQERPDVLFINSMGESFANDRLDEIIALGRKKGLEVSLYTNGYLLEEPRYAELAGRCDEVSGEIKAVTEEWFRKLQRPLEGRTLEEYTEHMVRFREKYQGLFTVYVTLMKGVNDDPQSIEKIRQLLDRLAPSRVVFESLTDERFGPVWGIAEDKMEALRRSLAGDA